MLLLVDYLKQQQIPLQSLPAEDNPGITDVGGSALIDAVSTTKLPVEALELEGIEGLKRSPTAFLWPFSQVLRLPPPFHL